MLCLNRIKYLIRSPKLEQIRMWFPLSEFTIVKEKQGLFSKIIFDFSYKAFFHYFQTKNLLFNKYWIINLRCKIGILEKTLYFKSKPSYYCISYHIFKFNKKITFSHSFRLKNEYVSAVGRYVPSHGHYYSFDQDLENQELRWNFGKNSGHVCRLLHNEIPRPFRALCFAL